MERRLINLAHRKCVELEARLDASLFSEEERPEENHSARNALIGAGGLLATGGVAHHLIKQHYGGYGAAGRAASAAARSGASKAGAATTAGLQRAKGLAMQGSKAAADAGRKVAKGTLASTGKAALRIARKIR